MKLKNVILLTVIVLQSSFYSSAQVNVGPMEIPKMKKADFKPGDLEMLKKTKTVFVYGKKDKEELENWKKVFEQVWNFTQVEFISYEKFNSYVTKPNYSFFTFGGVETTVTGSVSYENIHLYLMLWINEKNSKGKDEKKVFCRIELYPQFKSAYAVAGKKAQAFNYFYSEAVIYNWYPGLLKNDLKLVNDCLSKNESRWLFENSSDPDELKKLKSETLYMADFNLINFAKFTGDESKKHDESKLMKDYSYKYKYMPAKELSDMIVNEPEKDFYYFLYVRSSTDKFLNVFNSKSGDLLYAKYKPISYNLNDSDFEDIVKIAEGKK